MFVGKQKSHSKIAFIDSPSADILPQAKFLSTRCKTSADNNKYTRAAESAYAERAHRPDLYTYLYRRLTTGSERATKYLTIYCLV